MATNHEGIKEFKEALQHLSRVLHVTIAQMDAKKANRKAEYEREKRGMIDVAKSQPTQSYRLQYIEKLTRFGLTLSLDEELEIFFASTSDAEGQP